MGYFLRNIVVYGAIALVIGLLYIALKGMKNKDRS